jgi:hypothetical protein
MNEGDNTLRILANGTGPFIKETRTIFGIRGGANQIYTGTCKCRTFNGLASAF